MFQYLEAEDRVKQLVGEGDRSLQVMLLHADTVLLRDVEGVE